jgi:hypothetical protein
VDNVSDYDDDIIAWSERQAALLRALAGTVQGLPNDLDLLNIAEEIEDVGKSVVRAARSQIRLIFVHLIKASAVRNTQVIGHWRAEAATFHAQLLDERTLSLHRHVDVDREWERAVKLAREQLKANGDPPPSRPSRLSPFSFDDLVVDDFDFDAAVARLTATRQNSAA